jgi:hypothetical protein
VSLSPITEERTAETQTAIEPAVLHRRERQEFGGTIQWEAAFFGLLAGFGLAALLTAMTIGGLIAVDVIGGHDSAADIVDHLSVGGGAILLAILALATFTGGYVAGRMARFDGWRQGLGIWLLGALMVAAVGVAAWISGGQLDPTQSISLPENPIDQGPLSNGAVAAAVAAAIALLCSIAGGVLGERFHREVDRVASEPVPDEGESEPA